MLKYNKYQFWNVYDLQFTNSKQQYIYIQKTWTLLTTQILKSLMNYKKLWIYETDKFLF